MDRNFRVGARRLGGFDLSDFGVAALDFADFDFTIAAMAFRLVQALCQCAQLSVADTGAQVAA